MAPKAGRFAQVWFNGYDLSGYLNSAEFSLDQDTGETTTFSGTSNAKTFQPTLYGATLSCAGYYDPSQDTIHAAQLGVDSGVATYCPGGGYSVGDVARLMSVTTSSYAQSDAINDIAAFSWEAMSEASVGFGQVLHPSGVDTNTTTGAEKDDSAATSTGWTANLHVFAVSSGTWTIKLQDAAVTNTYSDVSGGSFTAATGVTSQRLQSATGATLRRFVRYVATVSGGSTPTITFGLSYSRSI